MAKLIRGGKMTPWILKPIGDPTWSSSDWGRAATLEARFTALGVKEEERWQLIPCAVLLAKWPATRFTPAIDARLATLMFDG